MKLDRWILVGTPITMVVATFVSAVFLDVGWSTWVAALAATLAVVTGAIVLWLGRSEMLPPKNDRPTKQKNSTANETPRVDSE